jgi:hypothetical protein
VTDTIICVASGPSITQHQIDLIKESGLFTICVNRTFELLPNCDAIFACDIRWWYEYYELTQSHSPKSKLYTIAGIADHFYKKRSKGQNIVQLDYESGIGLGKHKLIHGGNSGYMAVNLAYLLGAKKIILIGYDHQHTNGKRHWHSDYDKKKFPYNADNIDRMKDNFEGLAHDLINEGIDIVNCSIETALETPRRSTLEKEI